MGDITRIDHSSNGVQFSVQIDDHTSELVKKLAKGYYRGLKKIGMRAVTYAKRLCPVDTGHLKNNITSKVSGDPLLTGMKARPFLRPAATEHSQEYGEILKEEVNKA